MSFSRLPIAVETFVQFASEGDEYMQAARGKIGLGLELPVPVKSEDPQAPDLARIRPELTWEMGGRQFAVFLDEAAVRFIVENKNRFRFREPQMEAAL